MASVSITIKKFQKCYCNSLQQPPQKKKNPVSNPASHINLTSKTPKCQNKPYQKNESAEISHPKEHQVLDIAPVTQKQNPTYTKSQKYLFRSDSYQNNKQQILEIPAKYPQFLLYQKKTILEKKNRRGEIMEELEER